MALRYRLYVSDVMDYHLEITIIVIVNSLIYFG